ncbi:hypothetical protein JVU11DRAFT_9811 [Chiua virens]|nr:hypothetical protein JVU11DRAFT_9811 [Chiua virens]
MDFHYLTQVPSFNDNTILKVSKALQEFHDHKDTTMLAGGQKDSWEIPKLELLQGVVLDICRAGPIIQWSADPTEHAHVQEIKILAQAGNNQDYYSQIACHLDQSEKCLLFDIAMLIQNKTADEPNEDKDRDFNKNNEHALDPEDVCLSNHLDIVTRTPVNYFTKADALSHGCFPNSPKPHCTFSTSTTAFHLALKASSQMSIEEAANTFNIPNLQDALSKFLLRVKRSSPHNVSGVRSPAVQHDLSFDHLQIWYKICVQQMLYHSQTPGRNKVWMLSKTQSYHVKLVASILLGHSVVQLRMIFCPLQSDHLLTYVQQLDIVPQHGHSTHPAAGMHLLQCAVQLGSTRIRDVIPIMLIWSPAHLIPNFGSAAHNHLMCQNSHEVSLEFWLNKFWLKELYYSLTL